MQVIGTVNYEKSFISEILSHVDPPLNPTDGATIALMLNECLRRHIYSIYATQAFKTHVPISQSIHSTSIPSVLETISATVLDLLIRIPRVPISAQDD